MIQFEGFPILLRHKHQYVLKSSKGVDQHRGTCSIYYHGPHQMCIIAGSRKIYQLYPKVPASSDYEEE